MRSMEFHVWSMEVYVQSMEIHVWSMHVYVLIDLWWSVWHGLWRSMCGLCFDWSMEVHVWSMCGLWRYMF